MESYMADYGYGLMVSWNFRHAHLYEVGLTQIMGDRDYFSIFSNMTYCRAIPVIDSMIDSSTHKHHQVIFSNWERLSQILFSFLQHDPFPLHTMFEAPWLHKMAFPTPMARPLDESQGSSPLQGHGSWLMCEVALIATSPSNWGPCWRPWLCTLWTMYICGNQSACDIMEFCNGNMDAW